METTVHRRRLPTPEECVALSRFNAVGATLGALTLGVSGVMMALVWRVLVS